MPTPRDRWLRTLEKLAHLPLRHAAAGRLRENIPGKRPGQQSFPLEMMGRILAGIGPWIDAEDGDPAEKALREEVRLLITQALALGCDPQHADFWAFGADGQSLVDAAFLGQFLLRAPRFTASLPATTRGHLVESLLRTRHILPGFCNWLLFSACVEAALHALQADADLLRVDYALRQHEQWYLGDAHYGDGPAFHADFYNSFVIQPMMLDVLETFAGRNGVWDTLHASLRVRLTRYADVQERMIAPDGTWPPVGRSITYRCGAFHALSTAAWKGLLPEHLPAAQVRCALTAAMSRSLDAPGTWNSDGWLNPGLCGHQPALSESYISVPSLYLASFVFPALGLPPTHPFWAGADQPWTQVRIWENGENLPGDHALHDSALW